MPRPEENYHSTDRITNSYPSTEAGQVQTPQPSIAEPPSRTVADRHRLKNAFPAPQLLNLRPTRTAGTPLTDQSETCQAVRNGG